MSGADRLSTRLRRARALLREWRRAIWDSERDRSDGPARGTVGEAARAELDRFDAAIQAVKEAIKAAGAAERKSDG